MLKRRGQHCRENARSDANECINHLFDAIRQRQRLKYFSTSKLKIKAKFKNRFIKRKALKVNSSYKIKVK